jgi:hypothetical protein
MSQETTLLMSYGAVDDVKLLVQRANNTQQITSHATHLSTSSMASTDTRTRRVVSTRYSTSISLRTTGLTCAARSALLLVSISFRSSIFCTRMPPILVRYWLATYEFLRAYTTKT